MVKADGTLDVDATLGKQADAYRALEKRLGTSETAPATPEEYAPAGLPETVNMDELKADPLYQSFLKGAHAKGLNNDQVGYVINEWLARAPQLAAGADQLDIEAATTELRKVWTDDATMTKNVGLAYRGAQVLAAKANVDLASLLASPAGNDPNVLRMLAAIAPEFGEDVPAGGASAVSAADFESQVAEIRAHPGYRDANHPQHAELIKKQNALYERRYGKAAAGPVTG